MALTSQEIINSDITSKTYAQLTTLKNASTLVPGFYLISDKANLGIIVRATSTSAFALAAVAGFLNPDFINQGDYSTLPTKTGVGTNLGNWNAGLTPSIGDIVFNVIDTTWFVNRTGVNTGSDPSLDATNWQLVNPTENLTTVWDSANTYYRNQVVIWNGQLYGNKTGTNPATTPNATPAVWTSLTIAANPTMFIAEWDSIKYDFTNDIFLSRDDLNFNHIEGDANIRTRMQWGNSQVAGNNVYTAAPSGGDETRISCRNNSGTIKNNTIWFQSILSADTNKGIIQGNNLYAQSSITADTNLGTVQDNSIFSPGGGINTNGNQGSVANNVLLSGGLISAQNQTGSINNNFVHSFATIDGHSQSGDIVQCEVMGDNILRCISNAGTINFATIGGSGGISIITLVLNAGIHNIGCQYLDGSVNYILPAGVSYDLEILSKQGSTFKRSIAASTNYSGGLLTLPANSEFAGIIILTDAAGGNITAMTGGGLPYFPIRLQCSNGISNTIQPALVAAATANQIVSDAGTFTLVGRTNGGDSADFEKRGNIVAKVNSVIMQ